MFKRREKDLTAGEKSMLSLTKQQSLTALAGVASTAPMAIFAAKALASVDIQAIAEQIFQWIGGGVIVIGIVTFVVGIGTFFSAEDDGPQKNKGKGQIAAGIGALAVGAAIIGLASQLADWVSGAFDN